jgi:NAD(P)-dependent dehydrogenase (short-subunit alcohol dehydrogenase family)
MNPTRSDSLFGLNDRVAILTGGMGQLGVVYAVALVECGARVALFDLATDPKIEHAGFAEGLASGLIMPWRVDVTDPDAVREATASVVGHWGRPDILINNAGLDSPPDAPAEEVGPFETYPLESFDRVMDVNVKGSVVCCQVVGALMADAGTGAIVNISSIYGILSPCQDLYAFRRRGGEVFYKPVAYSVSKSAVLNLTRYLATYWAKQGVRVNTLTLGGIFNDQPTEFLEAYGERAPIGRMANAEEMVGPMLFLVSDAASYMTGANMIVDGGWSAW